MFCTFKKVGYLFQITLILLAHLISYTCRWEDDWANKAQVGRAPPLKEKSWCWVYLHIQDPKHVLQCLVETKNRKLYKKSHWCSKGNITKQSWCMVLSVFIQSTINCYEHFVTDDPIHGQVICNSVHKYINTIITRSSVQILARVMEFSLSHAKNKSITKLNVNVHVYHGLVRMTIRASISLNIFVCNDTNLWFFSVF